MGRQPQTKEPRAEGGAGFSTTGSCVLPFGGILLTGVALLCSGRRAFFHTGRTVGDPHCFSAVVRTKSYCVALQRSLLIVEVQWEQERGL